MNVRLDRTFAQGTADAYIAVMTPVVLRLKPLRKARGLTQAELADLIGVRRATIADLENGASRQETLDLIERLCKALQVEPGELIVREKWGKR